MEAEKMNLMKQESLDEKENKAKNVILNNLKTAKNPFVLFDGDNYSLIILHLVKGIQKIPVLFVNTSLEFDEIYKFIEKINKLWRLNLIKKITQIDFNETDGKRCYLLKTEFIKNVITDQKIDCLFTDMIGLDNVFINPIATFNTEDIWNYIQKYNLPYCSLYNKGYEEIDFKPKSKKNNVIEKQDEEIIKEKLKKLGYL